jgi:hypothetical protein
MALGRTWRRWRNFRRWKKATTPMLLNTETGELIPFSSYTPLSAGKWMLRRPITLPGSPVPLFLEAPLVPGGLAQPKRPKASTAPDHQIALQHNIGVPLLLPPPQQSV